MRKLQGKKYANLLATDLDGTLVGDDQTMASLLKWMQNHLADFGLVYITGRHYQSVQDLIEQRNLPLPDLLVTDVGTEIHIGNSTELDSEWHRRMSRDWQPEVIKQIASEIEGIKLQVLPLDCRVSFYADDERAAARLKQKLEKNEVSFTYIFSSQRDVDILPTGGGKGEALKYIVSKYACDNANILAAGDSGNDSDMLTAGYPGVIVGNAQVELQKLPPSPLLYRAENEFAAGIKEGWLHFYGHHK